MLKIMIRDLYFTMILNDYRNRLLKIFKRLSALITLDDLRFNLLGYDFKNMTLTRMEQLEICSVNLSTHVDYINDHAALSQSPD
ncbi:hypothetical protein GEO21_15755 [Sphingobacterium faecium]|uniref:hypothetical protein n=1 Tax=Sphingobacterium faecium TaxID=34087 RepID=UPI001291C98E|nr:hypothetical protein [Sphingobacterium faecium]MQP28957.1 hypothetical protein [Sphingobacterium faecium]